MPFEMWARVGPRNHVSRLCGGPGPPPPREGSLKLSKLELAVVEIKATSCLYVNVGNESVPIQLAQCWSPGLAVSGAKI